MNMVQWYLFVLCLLCVLRGIATWRTVQPQCPPPPARCRYDASVLDEHFYYVEDKYFKIVYAEKYLSITCPENITLESEALPRFDRLVRVERVVITECAPPAVAYVRALAALNVTALDLLALVRPRAALRRHHLPGLAVSALFLTAPAPMRLERGTLAALGDLLDLRLELVSLAETDLMELPVTLRRLSLARSNVSSVPTAALERLPSLLHLSLREPELRVAPDLSAARALTDAVLLAPLDALPTSDSVENVTLWTAEALQVRGGCGALRRLSVRGGAARALAPGWLAPCARLRALALERLRLSPGALPAALLHAARDLRDLTVRHCALTALPHDLLTESRKLRVLDLSSNKLETLPVGLFESVRALEELDLSDNWLSRRGAAPLFALRSLRRLALDRNPLGDLCGGGGGGGGGDGDSDSDSDSDHIYDPNAMSELRLMHSLVSLRLARSGASRLCVDWRRDLRALADLDLSYNNITQLEAADLQWERAQRSAVRLRGNALRGAALSPQQYDSARRAAPPAHATIFVMDATLTCDCRVYWLARLVQERAGGPLQEARCSDGRALRDLQPERLVCALPAAQCAARCDCSLRGARLSLRCAGARLSALPRLPPGAPPPAELLLPNNSIAALRAADITPDILVLDLSDNKLEDVDAETAAAMFASSERRVWLAGNPLACRCGAALLAAAHAHRPQVADFAALRCGDGRRAAAVPPAAECRADTLRTALASSLAVLLLGSAAIGAVLSRRAVRRRFKRFLFERGLCLRWLLRDAPDERDDGRPYDVFVSFSHRDHEFVAGRLVPELEGGAWPYRLCLHYRDWAPGDWIPAQIARSVRQSRRTLVVLSQHFVESTWARAEFREAFGAALRDARPRLVVLLLAEPGALRGLDPELRAYLAANTYLRWDDPWFWPKLRHALPRGAATAPPPRRPSPRGAPRGAPRARPRPRPRTEHVAGRVAARLHSDIARLQKDVCHNDSGKVLQ